MNFKKIRILLGVGVLSLITISGACNLKPSPNNGEETSSKALDSKDFESKNEDEQTGLYAINNGNVKAYFTNYGARLVGLWVPDKNGDSTDVVVGFGSVENYIKSTEPYFGATIGRFGNRIAKGKFKLNGNDYQITLNNGPNSLHGGKQGFQNVIWAVEQPDEATLIFKYKAKDDEEGFPGNLNVKVTYSITKDNAVKMKYEATTDKPTVVNLTNHAFFNLNGEGSGKILNHKVTIYAEKYTPVDSTLIPTGKLESVVGTPFDFTKPTTIGARIRVENEQLKNGKGYDHNFVLTGKKENGMYHAATVVGDSTGVQMDIYTEEPGLQFYSGNFMKGKNTFKNGSKDLFRTAFAMETQHFPDSPNQPSFPTTVLNPGETYHTVSLYKFSVSK